MSLTRLEYFVAVAEELNFTRAASRLHVSQPPLTQQIQRLEVELGVRLFDRTTRKIELTAAGRAVLDEARNILARYRQLPAMAHDATQGRVERLEIGFVPSAVIGIVPALLAQARQRIPAVSIRVHEVDIEEQLPLLRTSDLDIGFYRSFEAHPDWHTTDLGSDDYVVALPVGHPLAAKASVEWRDLANEHLIATDRSRAVTEFDSVVAACVTHGFSPRIVAEAIQGYNTIALVASGLGVAIVPGLVTASRHDGMTYRPLTPPMPTVPMKIVVLPQRRTEAVKQLIDIAQHLPLAKVPTFLPGVDDAHSGHNDPSLA